MIKWTALARGRLDLILVIGVCLLQMFLVFAGITGIVRVASGFLFTLLVPGYSLVSVLYRPYHKGNYLAVEQLALAVAASIALNAISGMMLNLVGLALSPYAQVMWIALASCAMAVVGILRGSNPDPEGLERSIGNMRQMAGLISVVVLTALGLGLTAQMSHIPTVAKGTDLYVLDANATTTDYPLTARVGEEVRVVVGVDHRGETAADFTLVTPSGERVPLTLQPGEGWEMPMKFRLTSRELSRIGWDLYAPGGAAPIRSVHLWVRGN